MAEKEARSAAGAAKTARSAAGGRKSGVRHRPVAERGAVEENKAQAGERIFPLWIRLPSCLKTQFRWGLPPPLAQTPAILPTRLENIFKRVVQTQTGVKDKNILMESSSILPENTKFSLGLLPQTPAIVKCPGKTGVQMQMFLLWNRLLTPKLDSISPLPAAERSKTKRKRKERKNGKGKKKEAKKERHRSFFLFLTSSDQDKFAGGRKFDFMDRWQKSHF